MIPIFTPILTGAGVTAAEIDKANRYLCETRDGLVQAAASLSEAQWNFKPAPDLWSIAEIVEHLALIEGRVHLIIERLSDAPPAGPFWNQSDVDEFILAEVPKRGTKIPAPLPVLPTHRWSGVEALQQFLKQRAWTIELLSAPALRGHVIPHPFLGPWDGYQWLLATAAHTARHSGQIHEVMTGTHFPG